MSVYRNLLLSPTEKPTPLNRLDENSVVMMGECTTVSVVVFFLQDRGDVVNFLYQNVANFLRQSDMSTIDATARQQ